MKENVLVLFGGKSVEHDISIITAMQVLANFPSGYQPIPLYISQSGDFWTGDNLDKVETFLNFNKNVKHKKLCTFIMGSPLLLTVRHGKFKSIKMISCAINCCHGGGGEGGALQGVLESCRIPSTCCDHYSSSVCMDKVLAKLVLQNNRIATPKFLTFSIDQFNSNSMHYFSLIDEKLGFPVIVKPSHLGSSVGISIASDAGQLRKVIEDASEFDKKIIVEKYIPNVKEYCCAVMNLGDKLITSKVVEVKKGEFYSFDEKYLNAKSEMQAVPKKLSDKVQKVATQSYQALECSGIVRIDFLYDGQTLYVCEANTIPGSLAFNLFSQYKFSNLIESIIESAKTEFKSKDKLLYTFSSKALQHYAKLEKSSKLSK